MYDPTRNELWFPHVINGDVFDNEKQGYDCIDGGYVKPDKLGFDVNWFGGVVKMLGKMSKYGVLACPRHGDRNGRIMGFLVPSGEDKYKNMGVVLTKDGKKAVEDWANKTYPGVKIVWEDNYVPAPIETEDMQEKRAVLAELARMGKSGSGYSTMSLTALKDLLASAKMEADMGVKTKPAVEVSGGVVKTVGVKGERNAVNRGRTNASLGMIEAED